MRRLGSLTAASPAALALGCAIPFIFLHPHYQPHLAVGQVDIYLTDLAILGAVLVALADGRRRGFAPLRAGRSIWPWLAAFLALLLLSLLWARSSDHAYSLGHHAVSALKFVEYASLAPATALTVRRPEDRQAFYWAVALWTAFLVLVAALQFLGLVDEFAGRRPIQREPSYIGIHDLGALAGGSLAFLLAGIAIPPAAADFVVAGVAGACGVALAAALDAVGGVIAAAVAIWALARRRGPVGVRRTLAIAVICAVVTVAAVTLRSSAIVSFLRFLGVERNNVATSGQVQSYSQRVLLGYIGIKIWIDHPLFGAGWQESHEPHSFEPALPSARRRFRSQPAYAFPSRAHKWGVQNGVIQTLADLGVVGLVLLAGTFVASFRLLIRIARRGRPSLAREALLTAGWLLVALATFTGTGLLPGTGVDAQLWIGLGLTAALNYSLHAAP